MTGEHYNAFVELPDPLDVFIRLERDSEVVDVDVLIDICAVQDCGEVKFLGASDDL